MSDKNYEEFTCAECKRSIVRFGRTPKNRMALCAECIWLPGWYRDPELCSRLDPVLFQEQNSLRGRIVSFLRKLFGRLE